MKPGSKRSEQTQTTEKQLHRRLGYRYKNRHIAPNALVTIAQCWEDVMVIVAGGAGKHSMWVPEDFNSLSGVRLDHAN